MKTDFVAIAELRELVKPLEMGVHFARVIKYVNEVGAAMWRVANSFDDARHGWHDFADAAGRAEVAP